MSARNAALDRTRTAMTVLVVIHHAVIPYTYYGKADPDTWIGFDGIVLATDSFFMALFFFLSGLFVWPSLQRRTPAEFLRERLLRLGLPFAVAALFLMPLAYYAMEIDKPGASLMAYWWKTVTAGPWPSGPVWFVWVLLVFDLLAALLYRLAPNALMPVNRLSQIGFARPALVFAAFLAVTAAAYVPMRLAFGPARWFGVGPFDVQASRIFLYLSYFFFGAGIGLARIGDGILAAGGHLTKHWPRWAALALIAYGLLAVLAYDRRVAMPNPDMLPLWSQIAYSLAFALFSAAMAFAILAWFIRFDRPGSGLLDAMRPAAYGIFLVHYVPVLWLQHWLLPVEMSPFAKAGIAFAGGLCASWAATLLLLQIPGARRVL